jgi:phage baseplate assembly protein W
MTTAFDRPLFGFRFVETLRGDTLQAVAARELGDASRWPELISYNSLIPPFLTDDPVLVVPGVLLTGAQLIVPAPVPAVSSTSDPDDALETDVQLVRRGEIATDGQDFVTVSRAANLKQALEHRLDTDLGELLFHAKRYGSDIRRFIGTANGPTRALLAARAAKRCVLQDPRVRRVDSAVASVDGDRILVSIQCEAVSGRRVLLDVSQ